MVKISITPRRGNHARYFPHHGFLGLSPVILHGTVSTRLEPDGLPLEASRIIIRVRCYEGLGSHPGQGAASLNQQELIGSSLKRLKLNILWETEKVLWTPSDPSDQYAPLTHTDTPWKLVIPPSATQNSKAGQAVGSMTYRTWGAWWQIEAAIIHKPTRTYGSSIVKTYPIFLPNYTRPLPISHNRNVLQSNCSRFSYSITAPATVSCGDQATVSLAFSPLDPCSSDKSLVIKNVIVGLQRTLAVENENDLGEGPSSSIVGLSPDPNSLSQPPTKRWKLRHLQSRSRTTTTLLGGNTPSKASCGGGVSGAGAGVRTNVYGPAKHTSSVSTILAETDLLSSPASSTLKSNCRFGVTTTTVYPTLPHPSTMTTSHSPAGIVPRQVVLQIPKPKSRYHYSIGDSCETKWAVVSYSLVIKVIIKSKSAGLETITLNTLPVELMTVTSLEFSAALDSLRTHRPLPSTLPPISAPPTMMTMMMTTTTSEGDGLNRSPDTIPIGPLRMSVPPSGRRRSSGVGSSDEEEEDEQDDRLLRPPSLGHRPIRLSAPTRYQA